MSIDELYLLRQDIAAVLAEKLVAKKDALEKRLQQLPILPGSREATELKPRRLDPAVTPKIRNSERPSETGLGVVSSATALSAQLRTGKWLDDFRIDPGAT
jgi:DNA-binding protein H-NS